MTLSEDAVRAWSQLRTAAWIALVVHLVAGLAMAGILRHGLESNADLADRLTFLVDRGWLWMLGWLIWNAAALSILFFFFSFARAHSQALNSRPGILWFAVLLGAAGVPLDLAAEAIEMGAIPELAAQAKKEVATASEPGQEAHLFLALHRTATLLTGYVANGLYSLASLLLAWMTRREYAVWVWLAGLVVAAAGLGLSAATLAGSVAGMVGTNLVLGPALLAWLTGIALHAGRRMREAKNAVLES